MGTVIVSRSHFAPRRGAPTTDELVWLGPVVAALGGPVLVNARGVGRKIVPFAMGRPDPGQEVSIVVTTGHSSLRLAAAEQGRLLQVPRFGWHRWNGCRWAVDPGDHAARESVIRAVHNARLQPPTQEVRPVP